jgi:thioredoxin 1
MEGHVETFSAGVHLLLQPEASVSVFDFLTGGPKKDPEHLTDDNFKERVLGDGAAWVVDFWGPDCPWCNKMVPTVRILAAKYQGKVNFGELETSGNPVVTASFGVKGTPTFVFLKNGRVVERLSGFQTQTFLEEVIAAHFTPASDVPDAPAPGRKASDTPTVPS